MDMWIEMMHRLVPAREVCTFLVGRAGGMRSQLSEAAPCSCASMLHFHRQDNESQVNLNAKTTSSRDF